MKQIEREDAEQIRRFIDQLVESGSPKKKRAPKQARLADVIDLEEWKLRRGLK